MSKDTQVMLRLTDIEVRENVRSELKVDGLDDLAQSIASVGLLQPITVSPNGGDHMVLVAGHRRVAAIERGIKDGVLHPDFEIPAIVNVEAQDQGHRTVVQLIENLQRDDLPVIDEAEGFAALKAGGMAQKDIAKQVGRSEAHVSKRLKLLGLPEDVQVLVNQGGVPLEVALELPGVPAEVARDVAKQGQKATVRDVKIRKAQAKATTDRVKIREQLEKAGITVFPHRYGITPPEGKEARFGEPVSKVADLPKRIAGVVISDYSTDVELEPVTFRAPSKSELEHQAQQEAERQKEAKAKDAERKRFGKAVDAFVDNPPSAADLVALAARLLQPRGYVTSTFMAGKDAELSDEGRTLTAWQLSGEASSIEARKVLATVLVAQLVNVADGYGLTDEDEIMGLIATAEDVGVEMRPHTQANVLSALARIWQRDAEMAERDAEQAIAEAEAAAETEEEDVPPSDSEADEGDAESEPESE